MMRKLGKAAMALLVLVVVIAIGLMVWEPLSVSAAAPPPAHRYDSVIDGLIRMSRTASPMPMPRMISPRCRRRSPCRAAGSER
jgi:hypothetical protein